MPTRRNLLHVLSDGAFHSGEALGETLGVSRMAVWKHIRALRESGVQLETVRGKGYRFPASTELLDEQRILGGIAAETRAQLDSLEVFLEIDSTNTWLRERALQGAPSGTVCLAEMQHAGRGRHAREWVSPFAANLYLSLLWRSSEGAASLGGMSLAMGVAVLRSLHAQGVEGIGLKWPNDVLAEGKKLAGILIDVVGESTGPCAIIIGVGVNVDMPASAGARIDQPWIDLSSVANGTRFSRNRLAAALLDNMLAAIREFESTGLQSFLDIWRRNDVVDGRQVDLHLPGRVIKGRACGIDAGGALLVETATGRQRFASGEVSVRATT